MLYYSVEKIRSGGGECEGGAKRISLSLLHLQHKLGLIKLHHNFYLYF